MRNLDDLLEEAKWGKLTGEEIAYVASEIKKSKPGDDEKLYRLLHILGKSLIGDPRASQYVKLVEGFLVYPSDPMISQMAFVTLCCYWGPGEKYINWMKKFIRGVDWDDMDDVRLVAISIAGEYLLQTFDKELLELLVQTFEASFCSSKEEEIEDETVREAAYSALARVDGWNWEDLPPANVNIIRLLENGQLNLTPIENAKKRIEAA